MNVQALHNSTRDSACKIGQDFSDPEADWLPVAIIPHMGVLPIPPQALASEDTKDVLVERLRALILGVDADAISLVFSAWARVIPKGAAHPEAISGPRPSEDPERQEILMVSTLSADDSLVSIARIERDGEHPPTLTWDEEQPDMQMGRFVEPLQDALQAVARKTAA